MGQRHMQEKFKSICFEVPFFPPLSSKNLTDIGKKGPIHAVDRYLERAAKKLACFLD